MPVQSSTRGEFEITTDPARLDAVAIHDFLSNHAYWALGRSLETVQRTLANSLCFGVYHGEQQVGLARVITDYATYGYLCDVYVLPEFRGRGLGFWLIDRVLQHPELQTLNKFSLVTREAQELYRRFGFTEVTDPHRYMNLRKERSAS
ncbi:MAG: GNAT family N-acetyltransferase [Longimicrobiales bacterium]